MTDQNLELLCRPLLAMEWVQRGLGVLEVKEQDVICLPWPSTNHPIPGTGGEALRLILAFINCPASFLCHRHQFEDLRIDLAASPRSHFAFHMPSQLSSSNECFLILACFIPGHTWSAAAAPLACGTASPTPSSPSSCPGAK